MRRFLMAAVATLAAIGGAERALAQQTAATSDTRDAVRRVLDSVRATATGRSLPSIDRFTWGDLSIPAGATVDGPVAAARGNVNVHGLVKGDVFAVGGDVVVHSGGEVTGSALALQGKVLVDGGRVGGEMKAIAPFGAGRAAQPLTGTAAVQHSLKVAVAWYAILLLVGLGVIVFSGAQLEAVVQALGGRFSAALALGAAAQVGAIPLLVLLCVALALTIVGILLIPFAVVAYIIGAAGLVTLGGLASATIVGHAVVREGPNVRTRAVQSLVVGCTAIMLPWFASALLVNGAWSLLFARIVAAAVTWVALTAGLGAALVARGGMRRVRVRVATAAVAPEGWQTPTPIGGIVAARRPAATPPAPTTPAGT
jgi:hypothetical protein